MALLRMARRNRTDAAGSLGAVQRSIGYLHGGYKDATIHSRVQLFNTITQVGQIVYDSGYQRNYRPGISGMNYGFFSINDSVNYNKFNYITASAFAASFSTSSHPSTTSVDVGIYSQAWLLTTAVASWQNQTVNNWNKINLSTDSLTSEGLLHASPIGTTRQAGNTAIAGVFWSNAPNLTALDYNTKAVTNIGGIATLDANIQIPCGVSRDNSYMYFVGMKQRNIRLQMAGATIVGQVNVTGYTYHFGESHSVSSATAGYMMAGYPDTTGR